MKDTHKLILGLLLIAGLVGLLAVTARGTEHDPNTDYMALMEAAAVAGDSEAGQAAEAARNAKISDMGNPVTVVTWEDLYLLSKIIYAEAGSDWLSDEWKMSVGEVVLNRVAHPSFPDTVREVVYQPNQYYGSQSRWFETMRPDGRCVELAKRLLEGERVLCDPAVVYRLRGTYGAVRWVSRLDIFLQGVMRMKGIASRYIPPQITICANCFHRNVCSDKDYLTENRCSNSLDENLCVILPCKVGDTVWVLLDGKAVECIMCDSMRFKAVKFNLEIMRHFDGRIGLEQTVFSTPAEAEAALAREESK